MADQVSINMASLAPAGTKPLDSVDGHRSRKHDEARRSSGSSHHHSEHSDTDDNTHHRHHHTHHNGRRRSRSRSRSPTPSPSHSPSRRGKRDTGETPNTEKDIVTTANDVEPLLVNNIPRKNSQSELDDESNDDDNVHQSPQPGVDDGFFIGHTPAHGDPEKAIPHEGHDSRDHYPTHGDVPNFPFAPGLNPSVILDGNGNPQVIPDINVYQQKKNLAQGMMDLALLSANANQMRYILESYSRHPYYWFSVISISISLFLQIAVGVGLILNSRYNVKNKEQICRADKINNFTIIGIFLITIVNVFVSAFGVADPMST